jgi:hypothetical protein
MQNIGPFDLESGSEYEVFVAYGVGQGTDALSAINEGRSLAEISKILYDCNFLPSCVVSVEDQNSELQPNDFFLFQNFPNPFNPITKISWQLPVSSWQTLKVYDVLGNDIATLVDEYKSIGRYEVEWDASGFPSGVYFYTLKTDNFIETKKMILMR